MSGERRAFDELVRRAGADLALAERLRSDGLIGDPGTEDEGLDARYSTGDVRRVQLIEACPAAAMRFDDIVEAPPPRRLDVLGPRPSLLLALG